MRTWLPVEIGLVRHRKTRTLARLWHCHPYTAVGFLIELWGYLLEFQPDGDVSAIPEDDLVSMGRPADGHALSPMMTVLDALKDAGFVDRDGRCHDWDEYAGAIIERRRAEAQRKKRQRSKSHRVSAGPSAGLSAVSGADAAADVLRTVQHSTVVTALHTPAAEAERDDPVRGQLPESARTVYDGFLRSASTPTARRQAIAALMDGLHGTFPPEIVGRALLEMAANSVPFNARYLARSCEALLQPASARRHTRGEHGGETPAEEAGRLAALERARELEVVP